MSLSASDVTNRIWGPHRLQLDFVATCTACVCLNIQLSFNCQGFVMFAQWIYLFCCEASYVKEDKHSLRVAHPLKYLYFWMRIKSTRAHSAIFCWLKRWMLQVRNFVRRFTCLGGLPN
jgi:hypothetical protein